MFEDFDTLAKAARGMLESMLQRGTRIDKLLTDLYPDKAHFIFELLQNAEDAGATQVEFRLGGDSLMFVHNGSRLFELRDIDSITNIGDSTGREDITRIGRFGIGFKSVFAYTQTPEIHSGEWHFKISNMFVPERCEPIDGCQEKRTYFKFPFDNPRKESEKAHKEIRDGLETLDPESILFLRNINKVAVYDMDYMLCSIEKNTEEHFVELKRFPANGAETCCHFLVFSEVIEELQLEDGSNVGPMPIGIGYRLKERDNGNTALESKLSDRYEIVPFEHRNVYVFFPTEKEKSGLRFCIHAPFEPTPDRAAIRNTVDNRNLMGMISNLQVDSLTYLRNEGFLTTDFLAVLPNSRDGFGESTFEWLFRSTDGRMEMYKCFWENLIAAFKEKDFTPTGAGGYAPAKNLRAGDSDFIKIIDDDDLSKVYGEGIKWVKNARQKNQNADRFLMDLKIPKYGMSEFVDDLIASNGRLAQDVLSRKDNDRLSSFYVELYKYIQKLEDSYSEKERGRRIVDALKKMPIIRVEDDSMARPNDGVYLARQYVNSGAGGSLKFVHPEMLGEELPSNQKGTLTHFFAKLGIVVYDEAADMKLFIDNYWSKRSELSNDDCVRHLSQLTNLVVRKLIKSEIARRFPVKNDDGVYVEISKTYIDNPYMATGLSCMKSMLQAVNRSLLNPCYHSLLGESGVKSLLDHLADYGIQSKLEVRDSPVRSNPRFYEDLYTNRSRTGYGLEYDYDIPGLDSCVGKLDQQQGEMIWSLVLRERNKLEAFYSANSRDSGRHAPSKYICTLKKAEWIVCNDGNRRKPCDVTFENLPDGWIVPRDGYQDTVLKAIGFGSATETQREEQEKKDQVFKASGFDSAEEVDELKEFKKACEECGLEPKEALSRLKAKAARAVLPKERANDVERRERVVASDYEKAPEQKYVVVGRTVHVGNAKIRNDARTYLREKYGRDGKMFCQLCQECMPFNGRDGNGYFEATQVFMRMKKDIKEQFISLCPTCRAKYDEWVRRSQERSRAFKDAILGHKPQQGEESVAIPLPGDSENGIKSPLSGKSIYFTGTHFVDLRQAVHENEKLGGLDDFAELESLVQ